MHGNVWEWCEDIYQGNLGSAAVIDPLGVVAPVSGTLERVLRGGSWSYSGWHVRSAFRDRGAPVLRRFNGGFRLALGHIELRQGGGAGGAERLKTGAQGAAAGRGVVEQRQSVATSGAKPEKSTKKKK
jgi:hypothetical protein